MVNSQRQHDGDGCRIILSPNLSANWRTNLRLMYLMSVIAAIISLSFTLAGAWMVFPFAGIEVAALFWVVYWVSRKCNRKEVISVDEHSFKVERGYRQPEEQWVCDRFWVRAKIGGSPHPWHPDRIILRCRQNEIEIGEFLNDEDKERLISELRRFVPIV
jgi:uncharacterized membrane protein